MEKYTVKLSLLCKECHQESCDFDDRYFMLIFAMRKNKYKIIEKRNRRFMCKQRYEIVYQMNKNIPTIDKGVEKLSLNVKKGIAY